MPQEQGQAFGPYLLFSWWQKSSDRQAQSPREAPQLTLGAQSRMGGSAFFRKSL